MADLIQNATRPVAPAAEQSLITLVELMFFAYRDFTGEPDGILAEFGLGRAHHRVLHFVRRHPGLRVTELLAILKITKQSLGRVLTPLIQDGWVESRRDVTDQRARQLLLTAKGRQLADRLAAQQIARMADALQPLAGSGAVGLGPDAATSEAQVRRFLFAMISVEDRDEVTKLLHARPAPQHPSPVE
jgi:DNA-binding MarR family transcriptional regulator